MKEIYLGDGLYAAFDGYAIILRAPREHGDHWVSIEPDMFSILQKFARNCWNDNGEDAPL
jgi:hypothetical protein